MMTETQQPLDLQATAFPEKAAPMMNSQGEVIQVPPQPHEQPPQQIGSFDDVIALGDTALALPVDGLFPPTDDTGMEHKIISCGHVLKSTHDLARWSEKTGARRVNTQESIDSVSDLAINLEPNRTPRRRFNNTNNTATSGGDPAADIQGLFDENKRGGRRSNRSSWRQQSQQQPQVWQPVEGCEKSEVINCWPVLKSTHDQAQLSEKRGKNAVNKSETSEALDELALNQTPQGQQHQQCGPDCGQSEILNSWPVLKSTHDQAMISEKRGAGAVNQACATEALDEVIQNQGTQAGGSSLQSGLDTQAGSHIQMDNQQDKPIKESPEKIMEELHVHV